MTQNVLHDISCSVFQILGILLIWEKFINWVVLKDQMVSKLKKKTDVFTPQELSRDIYCLQKAFLRFNFEVI